MPVRDQTPEQAGLLVRDMVVRAAADEGTREFTGIGVPFGETVLVRDWWMGDHLESFERGSIEGGDEAKIVWRHGEVIGRVTSARDTEAGYEVTGKISDTALGRDAYALLRDGAIDRLSIGFSPVEHRENSETGEITHTKVRAMEFSLVPWPAYDSAKISEVRSAAPNTKGNTVPEVDTLTRADLQPVADGLELVKRELATLPRAASAASGPAVEYRSMGEFLKAVSSGDDAAAEFHRAYTGATTGDTIMKDSFVGDYVRLVTERRRIVNQFSKGSLPKDGLSVDYYQLDEDTTVVAKQLAEGDDLPFGKVTLKPANAPVSTYGGAVELSRQAIERATVPALNITLRALGLRYGRVTNAAVAAVYQTIIAEHLAAAEADAALDLAAGADATAWLNLIVDAALQYENRGYEIAGLNVSADVFKNLNGLKDGTQRLMRVYGDGMNQVGELNLSQVSGNLAGVKVSLLPNSTGNVASFYDPVAIETLESPGAPAQLQDDNIINLTKQYSIYGYQAVLAPFKDAILPVKFGA